MEVWFDVAKDVWCIKIGLNRGTNAAFCINPKATDAMHYKVVRIADKDGKPLSIKNREMSDHHVDKQQFSL